MFDFSNESRPNVLAGRKRKIGFNINTQTTARPRQKYPSVGRNIAGHGRKEKTVEDRYKQFIVGEEADGWYINSPAKRVTKSQAKKGHCLTGKVEGKCPAVRKHDKTMFREAFIKKKKIP